MMRVRSRPPLTRTQSIKEKISHETAKFFGVLPESLPDEESTRVEMPVRSAEEQKWQQRRFRHLKQYGVKPELVENKLNQEPKIGIDALTDLFSGVQTVSDVSDRGSEKSSDQISRSSRAHSIDSRSSRAGQPRLERRDSVAKMAYDTFSSFVQGRSRRRRIGEKTPEEAPYSAGPYISIRNQRHSLLPTCSFPRSGAITPYEGTESEDFAELGPTEFSKQSRLYRSVPTRERHISEEEFPPTSSIEEQNIKESTESDKSRKAKPKLSRAERIDQEDIEKEETIESGSAQRPTHLPLATARVHFDSTKEVPKILPIDTKMRAQGRTPMPSAMSIIDDEVFFDITPSVRSKPIFQFGTPGPEEFEAETRFKMPTPRQPTPMQPAPFPIKLPADVCPPTPDIKEITAEEEYMQRYYTRTPVHSKEMTIKTRTSDRPPMPNEYTVDGIQIKTKNDQDIIESILSWIWRAKEKKTETSFAYLWLTQKGKGYRN
uniref:Uncharacterized protein n=1 Tax=Acrobeloides nanus TaxID=290746 RepID=A0A914DH71_9BILA